MTADRETRSFQEPHLTGVVAGGSTSCEMRAADLPRNTTQESCTFFSTKCQIHRIVLSAS